MEARRKSSSRYEADGVTEKQDGDPTIEVLSAIEEKFLARVSDFFLFLHISGSAKQASHASHL